MSTLEKATRLQLVVLAVAALLTIAAAALAMTGTGASHYTAPTTAPRPNVIMILADDLGYADISAYKIDRFQTPNIDRIGLQGARFTDGYATAPVCAPSRAGLMTGRYQERFGFEYNDGPAKRDLAEGLGLAIGEVTLAQLLKAAGYHTGMIGKWHLGSQPQFYPMNRGFDEFVGFLPGETSYMDPDQPGVHVSFGPLGDNAANAARMAPDNDADRTDRTQPQTGQPPMRQPPMRQPPMRQPRIGQPRMRQRIADTFHRAEANQIIEGAGRHVVHNEKEYLTDYFADRATDFIQRGSQSGQPYFLYLAFNAVHSPHMVTAKYYDRFPQIKNHQERVYAAMVAALDDAVGRVLDAVEASGQAGNTLIYFASDNGCAMYWPGLCSCTPLRGGKLSHYEGGVRVPFMMRWPERIKPGLVYRNVVSLLDVLPTSVAAAGGKLPTNRIYDGVDLTPYLTGRKTGDPHNMLAWRRLPLFSIREGNWKLWESVDDRTGKYGEYKLLFNLEDDLGETTNLADKYPQKVRELEKHVHEWAQGMMDPKWPSKPPKSFSVCGTPFTLPI
jgi:arylsulfatase A-like enzyme